MTDQQYLDALLDERSNVRTDSRRLADIDDEIRRVKQSMKVVERADAVQVVESTSVKSTPRRRSA